MHRFIDGEDRMQRALLPHSLEDYVGEENPVRVIEVFIDELDLAALGFSGMTPAATGRPAYHPSTLLKIYLYGYLNRVQSSRRLERETQRNIELMWLTGRLMPDFKTIADFRKDNGPAIRATCRQLVMLCRRLDLFSQNVIAIDGSRFKAVNTRDKNYTHGGIERRMEQVESSIARYLSALDTADRQEGEVAEAKSARLKDKLARLKQKMQHLREMEIANRRAPVRHHQGLDGLDPLLDPHLEAGQYRNEPPRPGLQHQAGDRDHWCRTAAAGDPGLSAWISSQTLPQPDFGVSPPSSANPFFHGLGVPVSPACRRHPHRAVLTEDLRRVCLPPPRSSR